MITRLVLHPSYKNVYFKKAGWQPSWIEVAEDLVRNQYETTYAEVPAAVDDDPVEERDDTDYEEDDEREGSDSDDEEADGVHDSDTSADEDPSRREVSRSILQCARLA